MGSIDDISFPGIPGHIRTIWKQIVKRNMAHLNNSKSYTELSDKLDSLKIYGIGYGSKKRTIDWFLAHNDEIDLEDCCSC